MIPEPAKEMVDVIDERGRTVRTVTRCEMRCQRLPHRCVYILVFNGQGDLFIHQRTAIKDVFPGYWDVTVGGVPAAGEPHDQAARRELAEELGVEGMPRALFPIRYQDDATVVHGLVYRIIHEGPFRLQPEEITRGEFLPLAELAERTARDPFCPDGLAVLAEYQRRIRESKP